MFKNLALIGILLLTPQLAFAWASDCGTDGWCNCPNIRGGACMGSSSSCEEACGLGGGSVYTGPTPEQIRQQKEEAEQKDLNEASEDADDKGVTAYKNGDWNTALRYFKQAHDLNPDDPDIQTNLDRAQQKVNAAARANDATRELQAIAQVHPVDSTSAQVGFDSKAPDAGIINTLSNIATPESSTVKDPVVPDSRRTPAITAMEENRNAFRERITKLDDTLKTIDPSKDPVQIAKLKQEKTNLDNKVHYLNFSIGAILDKPTQDKPAEATPSK